MLIFDWTVPTRSPNIYYVNEISQDANLTKILLSFVSGIDQKLFLNKKHLNSTQKGKHCCSTRLSCELWWADTHRRLQTHTQQPLLALYFINSAHQLDCSLSFPTVIANGPVTISANFVVTIQAGNSTAIDHLVQFLKIQQKQTQRFSQAQLNYKIITSHKHDDGAMHCVILRWLLVALCSEYVNIRWKTILPVENNLLRSKIM